MHREGIVEVDGFLDSSLGALLRRRLFIMVELLWCGLFLWKWGVGRKQGTVGNKMGNEWLGKGKLEMREVTRNSTC
jgi:hypothetical protein